MNIVSLKIAYIALTIFVILLLLVIGSKTINKTYLDKSIARKKKAILFFGLVFWQVYVFFIAQSGVLMDFSFPPKFFLFLILPLFVFTGIFIYRNRNQEWIANIPKQLLVFYQSFRILVESIFVVSVAHGILNPEVTIQGYNYDMVFAYTAPVIGFLFLKNIISNKLVIIWNLLGLAVLISVIFLFISSIFNPQLFGSETMILPEVSVTYPYVLVAGFLMPSAVFIHVLSIAQLTQKNKHS